MSKVKKTRIPLPGEAVVPAVKLSKAAKPSTAPIAKDDSSSDDSSSESSSDESSSGSSSAGQTDATKAKSSKNADVKKSKTADPESSSGESDDNSEESSDEESEESKKADSSKVTTASGSASGSDSSSEGSESESEVESEENAPATNAPTSSFSRLQTTQFGIAKPFAPPSGFKQVKSGLDPSSNLAKLLQSTDLSKKQIWHITAPADIDIKQVKEFARGKTALKEPALEHKGVGYGFVPEEKDTRVPTKLLVPSEKGYAAVPAEIAETLHLQQIVSLPKLSGKHASSARSTGTIQKFVERPEKPARPQPQGLRMRYKPYGHSGDVVGMARSSNSEDESVSAPKRKHGETNASAEATTPKKSKKEKKNKEKSSKENAEEGEPMEGVESTAAGESEKKKKKKDGKKEKKRKE